LGCHVMILHHLGKAAEAGSRGSSAIVANVDTVLTLSAAKDDDERACVLVTHTKQRDLPLGPRFAFRIASYDLGTDADGRVRTTARAVLMPTGGVRVKAAASGAPRPDLKEMRKTEVLSALTAMMRESG